MFNLKKAKADPTIPYDKQLKEHREESGTGIPDEGITELQFKHNVHKDKDNTVHFESQLEKARSDSPGCIVENCLNTKPTVFNLKRDDRTHDRPAKSQDLVAAAYDQKQREALAEANKGQDRDTEFWDKEVGIQMIGKPTKIVSQNQKSQLPNTPDRFKNLEPDLLQKVDDSVIAKLCSADKMLFHIYATAANNDRKLTTTEEQQVKDINSGKIRLLVAAQTAIKTGQFEDYDKWDSLGSSLSLNNKNDMPDELSLDDEPPNRDMPDTLLLDEPSLSIKYLQPGEPGVAIVSPDGKFIDEFSSVEEARANYPELSEPDEDDNVYEDSLPRDTGVDSIFDSQRVDHDRKF
jgi:hypothetical protein